MGFFSGVKHVGKKMFDFPTWMDFKRIKSDAGMIKSMAAWLLAQKHSDRVETFEEAMARLNLNETILAQRAREFRRLFWVFFLLSIALIIYCVYLFRHTSLLAGIVCAAIACFALGQAFRFDFWLFQIRQRRLGCSFREWFIRGVLRVKP